MGPKSTLRLMRTLGSSLASLAQSYWSLLSNVLGGSDCIISNSLGGKDCITNCELGFLGHAAINLLQPHDVPRFSLEQWFDFAQGQ